MVLFKTNYMMICQVTCENETVLKANVCNFIGWKLKRKASQSKRVFINLPCSIGANGNSDMNRLGVQSRGYITANEKAGYIIRRMMDERIAATQALIARE